MCFQYKQNAAFRLKTIYSLSHDTHAHAHTGTYAHFIAFPAKMSEFSIRTPIFSVFLLANTLDFIHTLICLHHLRYCIKWNQFTSTMALSIDLTTLAVLMESHYTTAKRQ